MQRFRRIARRSLTVVVAALPLSAAGVVVTATDAFGYGKADNPIAQVELSGNCDNPTFTLCLPGTTGGVGLGGVWAWSELDTTSTGAGTSGTMDATVAFCQHAPFHGAFGHPDRTGTWQRFTTVTTVATIAATYPGYHLFPFYNPTTYDGGSVYVLDFNTTPTPETDFIVVVPTQQGHYSQHPAPGVSLQLQVAP